MLLLLAAGWVTLVSESYVRVRVSCEVDWYPTQVEFICQ